MATSKRGYRPPAKNKSTKKGGVEKGYVPPKRPKPSSSSGSGKGNKKS